MTPKSDNPVLDQLFKDQCINLEKNECMHVYVLCTVYYINITSRFTISVNSMLCVWYTKLHFWSYIYLNHQKLMYKCIFKFNVVNIVGRSGKICTYKQLQTQVSFNNTAPIVSIPRSLVLNIRLQVKSLSELSHLETSTTSCLRIRS